jgi:hypothetical protein
MVEAGKSKVRAPVAPVLDPPLTFGKEVPTNFTSTTTSLSITFLSDTRQSLYRALPDTRQRKVVVTASSDCDGTFTECPS